MDKNELISQTEDTYREYQQALDPLAEEDYLRAATCGDWSVKDVIAHVTWYERQMVQVMEARAVKGSDLWYLPLEERNMAIYQENEALPLNQVLEESARIHARMMELMQGLEEDELTSPARFKEMPIEWLPWEMIASNTCEHYPVHTLDIGQAFKGRED